MNSWNLACLKFGAIGATTSFFWEIFGTFDAESSFRECKYDLLSFGEAMPEPGCGMFAAVTFQN